MSSLKARLHNARAKLLRRNSAATTSTASRSGVSSAGSERSLGGLGPPRAGSTLRNSISLSKLPAVRVDTNADKTPSPGSADAAPVVPLAHTETAAARLQTSAVEGVDADKTTSTVIETLPPNTDTNTDTNTDCPALTLEEPTPVTLAAPQDAPAALADAAHAPDASPDARVVTSLLATDADEYFPPAMPAPTHRKIWVKRPNASATLVQIRVDDLVDDVRDMILKKYANSLGRSFDAPDVTLHIVPRDASRGQNRVLGPEEDMCSTLDQAFPGGQTVADALLIDVPTRRTPKPSPRVPLYYAHHDDSQHDRSEYFPPMPVTQPSPAALTHQPHSMPHSIAVLSTGQLPPLASPGAGTAASRRLHHSSRPKYPRTHTASPTIMAGGIPSTSSSARAPRPRQDSSASDTKRSTTTNAPIPTPPAPVDSSIHPTISPPTLRVASPRPEKRRKKKEPKTETPNLPAGLLDGSVPPINVLIVEDNIINLRVLGAFMQRLKVRWQRAMNGKEAVTKWRAGGFHLVLMDIQLPVMNGLEATKEIRRLERVNSIGVFSSGASEAPNNRLESAAELGDDDKLGDRDMFKSPVIIVALTASSLQSDRHEALAAGCNDFLTKPVNFVWLERKVKEWGCMQALIDFDGWRKWKDFATDSDNTKNTSKLSTSMASIAPSAKKDDDKKAKRKSIGVLPPPLLQEDESEAPTPEEGSA